MNPVLGALFAGAPLYMGALRLARFNVSQSDNPLPYFEGLPAPMAAFGLVGLILFYAPNFDPGSAKIVMPAVIVISFLMVSHVRYMKSPRLSFKEGGGNTFFMLAAIITLLLVLFVDGKFLLPMISLFILTGIVRALTRTDSAADFQSIEKEA
jgi:CDP-diacylglycerol--serine O-phosphatidyltransferase